MRLPHRSRARALLSPLAWLCRPPWPGARPQQRPDMLAEHGLVMDRLSSASLHSDSGVRLSPPPADRDRSGDVETSSSSPTGVWFSCEQSPCTRRRLSCRCLPASDNVPLAKAMARIDASSSTTWFAVRCLRSSRLLRLGRTRATGRSRSASATRTACRCGPGALRSSLGVRTATEARPTPSCRSRASAHSRKPSSRLAW